MIKNRIYSTLLIIIGLMLLYSCEDDKSDDQNLLPFDGNFEFYFAEYHTDTTVSEPQLFLIMKTVEEYSCYNFPLITDLTIKDSEIVLDIIGVSSDINICAAAVGPASAHLPLNLDPGIYDLVFKYKKNTDFFKITITDSAIYTSQVTSEFSFPINSPHFRYIPNSFTYRCYYSDSTQWMCDDFIDSLAQIISIEKVVFPDSVFTPYDYGRKVYTYGNEVDFDVAGQYLKSYSESHIDTLQGIRFSIMNWKNKTYYSYPSYIDIQDLYKTWIHSFEEQSTSDPPDIYRPDNYIEFQPSRFRRSYFFRQDGYCEWLVLSPIDAHYLKSGSWEIAGENKMTVLIYDTNEILLENISFKILDLRNNLLKITPIDS